MVRGTSPVSLSYEGTEPNQGLNPPVTLTFIHLPFVAIAGFDPHISIVGISKI